jgi:hypothetical protein
MSSLTITKIAPMDWRGKMPSNHEFASPPPRAEQEPEPPVIMSPGDVKVAPIIISGTVRMEGRTPMVLVLKNNFMKCERYDEDIIQQMLMDDTLPMDERKNLSNYFRFARQTPAGARITYERSKGLRDLQLGRFYPVERLGLQSVRWDIRGPLLAKYYWDIDMENCHYNIALKYARDYGIEHKNLLYYCQHRNECLATVSDNRSSAKTQFLKLLFGGDISLIREGYEDNSGACKPEGAGFIDLLKVEVDRLAEMIWNRHGQYHKVKCGKEGKAIEKRPNKHFVLMSILFQTEESKCLMALDQFYTEVGRKVGVLIHDGATIEKEAGELAFPENLLEEASEAIHQMTGYRFRLTEKPIINTYVAPAANPNEYATMKRDFEKNNFLVGTMLHCISRDGVREQFEFGRAAQTKFAHLQISTLDEKTMKMTKKPFLTEWIKDPTRRAYDRIDFIPTHKPCPDYIYNLFTGFAVEAEEKEEMLENGYIDEEECLRLIHPFIHQTGMICGGSPDFALKQFAHLFQFPEVRSKVGMLFRDMGNLLWEGGGTGKNLLIEFLGSLLGDKYFHVVSDNSTLYGNFNSVFEAKLLIFIEEMDGKDNHKNNDKLKSMGSQNRRTINKKGIAEYNVGEYSRLIGATNGRNAIPTRDGQTRWAFFDADTTYRGNKEYFDTFVAATKNRRARVAFYQYLMRMDTWKTPIEFAINVPITPAFVDVRQMNAPPILKWLCRELRDATLPDRATTKELYLRFMEWNELNRDRAWAGITENSFGRDMKVAFISEDDPQMGGLELTRFRHTERGTEHRFDFPALIEGLERRYLLNKGECLTGKNGCLIRFDEPVAVVDDEKEEMDMPPFPHPMMGLKQPTKEEMEIKRK